SPLDWLKDVQIFDLCSPRVPGASPLQPLAVASLDRHRQINKVPCFPSQGERFAMKPVEAGTHSAAALRTVGVAAKKAGLHLSKRASYWCVQPDAAHPGPVPLARTGYLMTVLGITQIETLPRIDYPERSCSHW